MELTEQGRPVNPKMKQTIDSSLLHYPEKVRDHPTWKHDVKPWGGYPERAQQASIENHYLYRRPLEMGVGNYANLGTFRGASASAIAHGLKEIGGGKLYAVDIFDAVNGAKYVYELDLIFKEQGHREYVEFCQGFTQDWAETLSHVKFKFIFIDADHHYESCKNDFECWSPLLEEGGVVAFHDVDMLTVDRVINEMGDGWEMVDHVWKIKSFRRKT